MNFPEVDICLSPKLYEYHRKDEQVVVLVDVIRASTSMCVAFSNKVNKIIPVETVEIALEYKKRGYLVAGERESFKIPEFDFGNSPAEFLSSLLPGKDLVMTTTNGTSAIKSTGLDDNIIIGCFLNSDAVFRYLTSQSKNILFLCSGWKNTVNIEDTLFAGLMAERLIKSGEFVKSSDSVSLSISLFESARTNIFDFIINSSPRLKSKLSYIEEDIKLCLFSPQSDVLPFYTNGEIINLNLQVI